MLRNLNDVTQFFTCKTVISSSNGVVVLLAASVSSFAQCSKVVVALLNFNEFCFRFRLQHYPAAICGPNVCPSNQQCIVAGNRPKCVCQCVRKHCNRPGPVCGSDRRTYTSFRQLVLVACRKNTGTQLAYWGRCKCERLMKSHF